MGHSRIGSEAASLPPAPTCRTDEPAPQAYLEYFPDQIGQLHRVLIAPLPFVIGRGKECHHSIYSKEVSKRHASIIHNGKSFRIVDQGSTNGTYLNGQRIEEADLSDGDILHFGGKEYCFSLLPPGAGFADTISMVRTALASGRNVQSLIRANQLLREMLKSRSFSPVFQPIVELAGERSFAVEVLLRGEHRQLSEMPEVLFRLAESCRMAVELSRSARSRAASSAKELPAALRLFMNLHPQELNDVGALAESLRQTQHLLGSNRQLVVEISERAITDLMRFQGLRSQLRNLGIEMLFDGFGGGQARLRELVDATPDYVKLDRTLVQSLESSPRHRDIVASLTSLAARQGIRVIAQGIETAQAAQICRNIGCDLGQGFFFGRPQTVSVLAQ